MLTQVAIFVRMLITAGINLAIPLGICRSLQDQISNIEINAREHLRVECPRMSIILDDHSSEYLSFQGSQLNRTKMIP
jgi:hypothetical protein